jgi:hypothetical protein
MHHIVIRLLVRNTYILIVGTDARKLIADGYPLEQVVTSDLQQGGPFCLLKVINGGLKHPSAYFVFVFFACRIREPRT